jgi:thermostable 8-oxoguanine DNA glycosylase
MKAIDYQEDLNDFMSSYSYQTELTKKLDDLGSVPFDQEIINEIVLWKVNRYVSLPKVLLEGLDRIKDLKNGEHRNASLILEALLNSKGVDLPMASTILRFKNPNAYQIIDRHAYRAVTGEKLKIYASTAAEKKISIYFDYLDKLIELCNKKKIVFETVDRLLYIFDKRMNGKL